MKHTMAVIGFGGMGHWHCANVTEKIENLSIKGILDIRAEAKDDAKQRGLHVYESLEELLNDDEIELVTIATPNDFHKYYAIECMRAGKNVISEKPVTLNCKDLEEIVKVSNETGKLFTVHQNRRWDKDYQIVKKIVQENILGTPYFIESRVQGSRKAMHGWRNHKQNGGGMVLDWGAHLIDQMLMMIDSPVVSVDAHLQSLYSDQVDDNIKIFLRFENGLSTMLEMVTNCLIDNPRWHVSCLDGTAVVQNWACDGSMVKIKADSDDLAWADEIVYTEAGPTRTMAPRPSFTKEELPLPEVETSWTDYYNNIVDVLEGKAEQLVKHEHTLRVMKIIDLIFKANEERKGFNCHI